MGHIDLTALTKLGQNTIGVRLRGPSTAKYSNCAMAKITRQISRRPNPNKVTRPFYRIYLDWFDLEEGWDRYQYDGQLVRRCLLLTCEATGITSMSEFSSGSFESLLVMSCLCLTIFWTWTDFEFGLLLES